MILSPVKLGPNYMHFFQLKSPRERCTHVKVSIYPDGGIKRIRIIGTLAAKTETDATETTAQEDDKYRTIIVEEGWEVLEGIEG
jgi:allantoicase